jgi:hypothetical protein
LSIERSEFQKKERSIKDQSLHFSFCPPFSKGGMVSEGGTKSPVGRRVAPTGNQISQMPFDNRLFFCDRRRKRKGLAKRKRRYSGLLAPSPRELFEKSSTKN